MIQADCVDKWVCKYILQRLASTRLPRQILCICGYRIICYVDASGSLKCQESFIKQPYRNRPLFYKRPSNVGSLLIGVTPYEYVAPYEYVTPYERVTNKYAICVDPTHVCDPYMSPHMNLSPHMNTSPHTNMS